MWHFSALVELEVFFFANLPTKKLRIPFLNSISWNQQVNGRNFRRSLPIQLEFWNDGLRKWLVFWFYETRIDLKLDVFLRNIPKKLDQMRNFNSIDLNLHLLCCKVSSFSYWNSALLTVLCALVCLCVGRMVSRSCRALSQVSSGRLRKAMDEPVHCLLFGFIRVPVSMWFWSQFVEWK